MTLRVGLVGAGPWAGMFHAPMLATGPATTLASVWARRAESAQTLAGEYAVPAAASFDELLDRCDAVAFAVPPDVQAVLAPRAAAAGRHLLLEEPLGFTVDEAEAIAAAVDRTGVQTLLMLRNRFTDEGRRFVTELATARSLGAQARFVTPAAMPGSPFATPWRVERGALYDLGPHVLDLLDVTLGPIETIFATGDVRSWVGLTTQHTDGAVSQVALSINAPDADPVLRIEAFAAHGVVRFDGARSDADPSVTSAITTAFAAAVQSGRPHPVDVHRGVYLQRLLARAEASLPS